jgi:tRNA threonylcarbamoyladenosine biosynthesis protein TsaB
VSAILAIDTATAMGSVAVGEPGRVLAEISIAPREQAAALLPLSLEALRLAGIDRDAVTAVVVGDGPGSFTGLRIGIATAKGILRTLAGATLRTAPSLLASAWRGREGVAGPIAALFDALRGEVFGAVYEVGADGVRVHLAPMCGTMEEIRGASPVVPSVAVGDGAALYAREVREWTGRGPADEVPAVSSGAGALIELLAVPGAVRTVADVHRFEPDYGRRAAAQDRWEAKHGRPLPHS